MDMNIRIIQVLIKYNPISQILMFIMNSYQGLKGM